MSEPIMRYVADSWCQEVPEVPQVLKPVALAAGGEHAGLRREVGGPSLPLQGASREACRRLEILVDGLGLGGVFPQPEAVVHTAPTGLERLAFAGYRNGEDVDHWWIGGDLDHAFKSTPGVITLLVGAGSLRGRRRPVARTSKSTVPLESLASGRFLATTNEPVESIEFEPGATLLGTRESLWLFAGSVAKLVRALPDHGPAVRIMFRFPAEEHWLPLLPALHHNLVSPELCATWIAETREDRRNWQKRFVGILEEMLGEYLHRVQVLLYDALHDVGSRLEAAVVRGEKPSALGLYGELSQSDELWEFVLHWMDDPTGLVRAADVVNLLTCGRDGLAVVVDEPSAARSMIGMAEDFARLHRPDDAARMAAIGPLGKILGGTPGPDGPFARFRGDPGGVIVLKAEDSAKGARVPTGDLLQELYFVR
ncbi:hypothetical protein [Actinomadura sp. NPDC049753]|uniref:hypothetical protein n=1 Tax=Actinomadura sp. NPDC049753 TaxID=3154739 RepID=UPI00343B63CC